MAVISFGDTLIPLLGRYVKGFPQHQDAETIGYASISEACKNL